MCRFIGLLFLLGGYSWQGFAQNNIFGPLLASNNTEFSTQEQFRLAKLDSGSVYHLATLESPVQALYNNTLRLGLPIEGELTADYQIVASEVDPSGDYRLYGEILSDSLSGEVWIVKQGFEIIGSFSIDSTWVTFGDFGADRVILVQEPKPDVLACGVDSTTIVGGILPTEQEKTCCRVSVVTLYTPEAANRSFFNIHRVIDLVEWQARQTLLNSAISLCELSLEFRTPEEFDMPDNTNDIDNHINYLRDNLSIVRDRLNVDIVMVLTNSRYQSFGGKTSAIGATEQNYFAVARANKADNRYLYVHELGHLLGGDHIDPDTDGILQPPFPFARAYEFTVGQSERIRYTVMGPYTRFRVPYFSNPDQLYSGTPTGIPDERDNARSLRTLACGIASLRGQPLQGGDLQVVFDCPGEGIPGTVWPFTPEVSGGAGPYSFAWNLSTDGINYGPIMGTQSTFPVVVPPAGQSVWLRVTVTSTDGQSITSFCRMRGTLTPQLRTPNETMGYVDATEENMNKFALSRSPWEFELSTTSSINVIWYDITGRICKQDFLGYFSAGNHLLSLSDGTMPAGLYVVQILANDHTLRTFKYIYIH